MSELTYEERDELRRLFQGALPFVIEGAKELEMQLDNLSYGPAEDAVREKMADAKELARRISALLEHSKLLAY